MALLGVSALQARALDVEQLEFSAGQLRLGCGGQNDLRKKGQTLHVPRLSRTEASPAHTAMRGRDARALPAVLINYFAIVLETSGVPRKSRGVLNRQTEFRANLRNASYHYENEDTTLTDSHSFTAENAAAANTALRAALGLPPQRFSAVQFVGMISDEIEQLRAARYTDDDIAKLLENEVGVLLDPQLIGRYYADDVQRLANRYVGDA